IGGTTLHYQQQGDGPDVILIHAFTSNMAIWALTGIVEELSCDHRVTTYDLRGHGLSGVTLSGYNSAQMAADLRELHSALGLQRAHLVGHSFGGVIAFHAALDFPEMVASVVLSDSYFPGLRHREPSLGEIDVWTDLRDPLRDMGVDLGDSVDFGQLINAAAAWSPQDFVQIEQTLGTATARWLAQISQLAGTRAGEEMFDECGLTAERIRQVDQPVTALYDEFSPFEATCDYLQQHLRDCRVDVVPGAKHVAPVQNPRALSQLVQNHLDRVST
ncbi:MAG: alpha/beta hydrolase, partial [Planctomycetota bacterium]